MWSKSVFEKLFLSSAAPLCGISASNSGHAVRCPPFIRDKSPTMCDAQLSESIFQTRANMLDKS